jgi:hypothetical protein
MIHILYVIKEDKQYVYLKSEVNGQPTTLLLKKEGAILLPDPQLVQLLNPKKKGGEA